MKKKLIERIENVFGSVTKFFRRIGYKNPAQAAYQFKKTKKNNIAMLKLIELYEIEKEIKNSK